MASPDLPWAAVILAAGSSSRMGRAKQLLPVGGTPLVVRAAEAALSAGLWPVVVVLGANGELVRPTLARLPVLPAENPTWQEGMASSLRTGVAMLQQFSRALPGTLIALCDQPGFTGEAVRRLARERDRSQRGITATKYQGICGAPAFFRREYFLPLMALTGDEGAKVLIHRHADELATVEMPELAVDLDTPEDYAAYRRPE